MIGCSDVHHKQYNPYHRPFSHAPTNLACRDRDLIPDPHNPRKHSRAQLRAIAASVEAFGFNAPILVDKNRKIVAGPGRYEAAMLLGIDKVPVILLDHLTPTQAKAYMLADNQLTDRSTWDDPKLAIHPEGIVRPCARL